MQPNRRRKKMLLNKAFQLRFIVRFALITFCSSLLFGGLVYFLSSSSTTVAIENTKVFVKPTSDFILPSLGLTMLMVLAVSCLAMVAMLMYVSHTIAGPEYRLNQEILKIKEGRFDGNFILRKNDQLKALADNLKECEIVLREKHIGLRRQWDELAFYLKDRNYKLADDDIARVKKIMDGVNTKIKFFKCQ